MQRITFLFFVLCIAVSSAAADVPPLINFQGKLTSATGVPVADGTYTIRFRIYSADTDGDATPCAGVCVWEETQNVSTQQGIYSVLLGSVNPLSPSVFSGPDRFIGVKVGDEEEMTPRRRAASVPYALSATPSQPVAFFVRAGSQQTVTEESTVILDVEVYDTHNYFSENRFTPLTAGYYWIQASVGVYSNVSGTPKWILAYIRKNGSTKMASVEHEFTGLANNRAQSVSWGGVVYFNGSTDYVELRMVADGNGSTGGSSYLSGFRIN